MRLFTDYCTLSELECWDSELAKIIKGKGDIKLLGYIYHLTKSQHIDRIHESDSIDGQSYLEPPKEKRSRFLPLNQSRLLEVEKHE